MQRRFTVSIVKEPSCQLYRFNNTTYRRETQTHLALLKMKWLLDPSHLLRSTWLPFLQTPGGRQMGFIQMTSRGRKCETTGTRVWKQVCYSDSQAATMINMRCKSVQQRGRIASKNSCKRLVDLLKLGIGTTRCRDLKRKFKLNAWIDSNPGRVIQLRLAGQEYSIFLDMGLMMMRRNCNRPRPR